MTRRLPDPTREAAIFMQNARREIATLQRDLHALRDGVTGAHSRIRTAIPKGGSRTIKGSRSAGLPPLLNNLGGALTRSVFGSESFYTSPTQSAAQSFGDFLLGQRVM